MFKINNVQINGFWGKYQIETDFNKDVNIFIGRNGTGKTTFIDMLQAIISVDLELLFNLQFDKIILNLSEKKRQRKIEVSKTEQDLQYKEVTYQIGTKKYKIPIVPDRELRYRNMGRLHPRFFDEIQNLKSEISELINVSYLSVNRGNLFKGDPSSREYRKEEMYNVIDYRLNDLIRQFITYQLELESEIAKHSLLFQQEVLKTMLFNESFDHVDVNKKVDIDLRRTKIELSQAYRILGILDSGIQDMIENHINAIDKAAKSINDYLLDKSKPVYVNYVTPLALLQRTKKINQLSSDLENKKKKILEPLNTYLKLLNEFHDSKNFSLKDYKRGGGLSIIKEDYEIPISQLSSGEKQLIILLTETLLQKNQQTLFIADEPELSLHIEWQRKVISSIIALNPNSQIIIATHSPEIVGRFKTSIINMENIAK